MNNPTYANTDPQVLMEARHDLIEAFIDRLMNEWKAQCVLTYGSERGWEEY